MEIGESIFSIMLSDVCPNFTMVWCLNGIWWVIRICISLGGLQIGESASRLLYISTIA